MASVLQVATIKDQGGNANAIEIANSSANVTINNLTATTASIPAAAGSSMVLVKSSQGFSVTNSDTLASAYIENCFNSTYRDYVVYITGDSLGTTQGDLRFRFGNSSGRIGDSHYYFVNKGFDSSNGDRNIAGSNGTFASILNGADGTTGTNLNYDRFVITMKIHNPQSSGGIFYTGTTAHPRYGTAFISSYIGGTYRGDNNSATNMQFYFSANTSANMNFQSYGIKTS